MAQALAGDFGVDAGSQHMGGMAVPQIVEADALQSHALTKAAKARVDFIRWSDRFPKTAARNCQPSSETSKQTKLCNDAVSAFRVPGTTDKGHSLGCRRQTNNNWWLFFGRSLNPSDLRR